MKKIAIAIMADPTQGEESLGRALNALILANDLQEQGVPVKLYFQGTGTRWVNLFEKDDHPGHALYTQLNKCEIGASSACAHVFKAEITTIPLLKEYEIPGLGSVSSLARALVDDYEIVTF